MTVLDIQFTGICREFFDINPTVFMRNARDTNQKSHKITGNYGYKKPK